ncbi:MAG TPA: CHAT domain-containing tetratricopeptide repeat protein [Steroidobacteraceae bacterium]|jgi:CHAT domain-containing protein|nr:CHAT domain-containing tetratricopeptide repeat protein [Steroidobacteraceae bacterium]
MAAFSNSRRLRPRWAAAAWVAAGLAACSAPQRPQLILAERCIAVSAAKPLNFDIAAPEGGPLRIAVRQRGISLAAALVADTASSAAVSPVDRYGELTFLADSRPARSYALRIVSRDSPDITGEACIAAEQLTDSDQARLGAERAFAAAAGATRARQWQRAFADYLAAARLFDRFDRQRSAEARQAMALLAYLHLDRPRDSYALAERALADFAPHADPGMRSALLQVQAAIIVESKAPKPDTRRGRALQLLAASGALASQARFGAREMARLTLLRGFVEYATGESRAAGELFAEAAAQCQNLRDWECYARARMNGAEIAQETSNNAVALQGYADGLRVLAPAVAPGLTADIWDNLGRLQGYMGLVHLGEQSQWNAIRLYADIDNCDGVRRSLSTLGSILVYVGNVDAALVYLNLATAHECSALLATIRAKTRHDGPLSGAMSDPGFLTDAGASAPPGGACGHPPASASLSADGATAILRALLAISYGAALEADPDVARRCLAAARPYAVTPRAQLRLANATGLAYIESGQAARARESFTQALDVADRAALAATHPNRGSAYLGLARALLLEHHSREALRYSARALLLGSARADVGQVVEALQVLAMSLRAAGDRQHAEQTLRTAVQLIEQVPIDDLDAETRATYLATQHGVFEELTDLLVDNVLAGTGDSAAGAKIWAAFAAAERGRARSLQYAVSQATRNESLPARSAARYQELASRLASVAASADAASGWSGAVGQLEHLSAPAEETFEPVTAEHLVPELARLDATLVEYATGHDDMFAFVIDAGAIRVVPLGNRKRIGAAAADLYRRLHDPEGADADVRRAAQTLAQRVIWPVTQHVTHGRVIFVPDDSLHTVPFAVMPWTQDPAGPLVLQHGETAVAPSALFITQHADARRARGAAPRFELIGDPVFQTAAWERDCSAAGAAPSAPAAQASRTAPGWTESLPRLPGSRTEVLAIADLARAAWPASHIAVHLGCSATPSALRQAAGDGADLLHVATHGYVDALRPRLSALALSRESATHSESGVFGLLDILEAAASARLVVLSACDTTRGRLLPGEGVLGPAQAYLQSGAAAVVASYWRIDDAATAAFMQTFYKYLLTQRLPIATALRRAQLEHAAGGAHSWAGFAVFGWPDGAI